MIHRENKWTIERINSAIGKYRKLLEGPVRREREKIMSAEVNRVGLLRVTRKRRFEVDTGSRQSFDPVKGKVSGIL
jgi:hypothetical protein